MTTDFDRVWWWGGGAECDRATAATMAGGASADTCGGVATSTAVKHFVATVDAMAKRIQARHQPIRGVIKAAELTTTTTDVATAATTTTGAIAAAAATTATATTAGSRRSVEGIGGLPLLRNTVRTACFQWY